MRKEETSSGISPEPLTQAAEILEEIVEIMSNKPVYVCVHVVAVGGGGGRRG